MRCHADMTTWSIVQVTQLYVPLIIRAVISTLKKNPKSIPVPVCQKQNMSHSVPKLHVQPAQSPQSPASCAGGGPSIALLQGTELKPKWRKYLLDYILLVTAITWFTFTVWYAFEAFSDNTSSKLFADPQRTILVLNILSHGAVFWFSQVVINSCENVRWLMASSPEGIGFGTFLGLSRATSNFGVLTLLSSNQRGGHRIWCIQRSVPFS